MLPRIGITPDFDGNKVFLRPGYAHMVERAGGIPIILAPHVSLIPHYLEFCDGFVLSGGDDPIMENWDIPTHSKATKLHPDRQKFELGLLNALYELPEVPVLSICLGMQLMVLQRGGRLDQHLPESRPDIAPNHWKKTCHPVSGTLADGIVFSSHQQAITAPGSLEICAMAPDGVIEAVVDPLRPFYLGVQWHPERTENENLGINLFRSLVDATHHRAESNVVVR